MNWFQLNGRTANGLFEYVCHAVWAVSTERACLKTLFKCHNIVYYDYGRNKQLF